MSTSTSYRSLTDLINTLNHSLQKLESGDLTVEELSPLLNDARELHERIAILQYVTHQTGMSEKVETAAPKVEEVSQVDSKISAAMDTGTIGTEEKPKEKKGLKLNFNLFSSPEPESTNQINLLDVIEEETPGAIEASVSVTQVEVKMDSANHIGESKETHSMNEVIAKVSEKLSLNEKLADGAEKTSLAAKLSRKPIKDLNEEIGLNQKFLFMNDLFGGENGLYKEAIAAFNTFANFDEASTLLDQLKARHNWDMESISVTKFIDLVERRYLS
jgi:hypothetical protein